MSAWARGSSLPEGRRPAQVDGLRGDHELDREQALAELDHLTQPTGRERGHRDPVLDALGLRGRDQLEGDRLSKQAGLGRERLAGHRVLAEGVLHKPLARREPVGKAGQRTLQELHHPLARARQHRRQGDAQEVEGAGKRERISMLATETMRASSRITSGFSCEALSSSSSWARTKPSASRAAPWICGRQRKVSGSCRFRAAPGSQR